VAAGHTYFEEPITVRAGLTKGEASSIWLLVDDRQRPKVGWPSTTRRPIGWHPLTSMDVVTASRSRPPTRSPGRSQHRRPIAPPTVPRRPARTDGRPFVLGRRRRLYGSRASRGRPRFAHDSRDHVASHSQGVRDARINRQAGPGVPTRQPAALSRIWRFVAPSSAGGRSRPEFQVIEDKIRKVGQFLQYGSVARAARSRCPCECRRRGSRQHGRGKVRLGERRPPRHQRSTLRRSARSNGLSLAAFSTSTPAALARP